MKDKYDNILEKVFNEVKDCETGVLFTCIEIMDKENSEEIIEYFSISPSASFYDDLQILRENPSFQPILTKIDPMNLRNFPLVELAKAPINQSSNFSIGLIITSALVIISLWSFLRRDDMNISRLRKLGEGGLKAVSNIGGTIERLQTDSSETRKISTPIQKERQANLCLVVPCERIESSLQKQLRSGGFLPSNEVIALVDDSVYFLAEESEKNDVSRISVENDLKDFPEGSDLFVQLQIPDGSNLIGADLKRILSRAISAKEEITIKKIGLLNDLNNLEKFHRA